MKILKEKKILFSFCKFNNSLLFYIKAPFEIQKVLMKEKKTIRDKFFSLVWLCMKILEEKKSIFYFFLFANLIIFSFIRIYIYIDIVQNTFSLSFLFVFLIIFKKSSAEVFSFFFPFTFHVIQT